MYYSNGDIAACHNNACCGPLPYQQAVIQSLLIADVLARAASDFGLRVPGGILLRLVPAGLLDQADARFVVFHALWSCVSCGPALCRPPYGGKGGYREE